jgi:hypothetical protein
MKNYDPTLLSLPGGCFGSTDHSLSKKTVKIKIRFYELKRV